MSFARCRRISTPAQLEQVRATPRVRLFEDRKLQTSGGLSSLLKNVTNNTNSTLAKSVVGNVTGQVLAPVIGNVTTISLINSITAPIVYGAQHGNGVEGSARASPVSP